MEPTAKAKASRRSFLRRGALAGSGLMLLESGAQELAADTAQPAPPNDTIKTIQGLRTIHGNFLNKPIPEPALETILQASLRTANASNNQSYSIIVVKDRKTMKDVCGYQGGCLLLYCADYNRLKASAESLGLSYDPGSMESFVTASTNTTLAAQTAVIAARSLGIDSLLTNGIHRGDMERLWKLLDLPQTHCFPLIALVLGYAAAEPAHRMGRLDGAGVVHNEKYHRLTKEEAEEITRKYDDKQLHLTLNDDWGAQGYKHYLDWYFKAWLNRGNRPKGQETQMLRRLRKCDFVETPTS
jgi:nitroreductase